MRHPQPIWMIDFRDSDEPNLKTILVAAESPEEAIEMTRGEFGVVEIETIKIKKSYDYILTKEG